MCNLLHQFFTNQSLKYKCHTPCHQNFTPTFSGTLDGSTQHRVNWSGFMQNAFSSYHVSYCKSEVLLLPIIDLSPSDDNCMYSTLSYIQDQAELLNIPTPCVTFDQPLWFKAVEIIKAKSLNIVCRLGGFHTMMSFIGSIG